METPKNKIVTLRISRKLKADIAAIAKLASVTPTQVCNVLLAVHVIAQKSTALQERP